MCGMAPSREARDLQGPRQQRLRRGLVDHQGARPHLRDERARGQIVIHGVNLSLGGEFDVESFNCGHTPLCVELRRLWRQGVVVVLAAGNEGWASLSTSEGDTLQANMGMSLGDPANLDEAIVVGSVHKETPAHLRHVVLLVTRADGGRPDEARLRRARRAHSLGAQRREDDAPRRPRHRR